MAYKIMKRIQSSLLQGKADLKKVRVNKFAKLNLVELMQLR